MSEDPARFYAAIVLICLILLLLIYCIFKFFCQNNSISYNQSMDSVASDRQSLLTMFNDDKQAVTNNESFGESIANEKTMNNNGENFNLLLNFLNARDEDENGLPKEYIKILKNQGKIFNDDDLKLNENINENKTENIKNLSSSFVMNTDPLIKSSPSCMFCLENLAIGDFIIYLPECNHLMHINCFEQWFEKKNFCPVCKKPQIVIKYSNG